MMKEYLLAGVFGCGIEGYTPQLRSMVNCIWIGSAMVGQSWLDSLGSCGLAHRILVLPRDIRG